MRKRFTREVYVRLTEGDSAFVCTVKRGGFFARFLPKTTEFAWKAEPTSEAAVEKTLIPVGRWFAQS